MGGIMATTQRDYSVPFNQYVIGMDGIVECRDSRGRVYAYLCLEDLQETLLAMSQTDFRKLSGRCA